MGSTFNPQILVEKLAKLNSTQQSIETLSHWCIFHMNKARQVVETWDRQFHCSPREQRLAFLYLANDILQNSRRKGSEFVGEFWKVLPDALRNVIESGDEFGRKASIRLINIWDERKVFGSRGILLKEEVAGRLMENGNRNGKPLGSNLRPSAGNMLDKIVSDYQVAYGGQLDKDVIVNKCRNAANFIERVDKEIENDMNSGNAIGSAIVEELQGQHSVLRNCIEELVAVESSRENLVSHLREALQEQEFKLDQIRSELQAAKSQSEQASNLCRQLLRNNSTVKEAQISETPHSSMSGSVPILYTGKVPFPEKSGDDTKAAAAAVAAKLTSSSSSAQMLTYVLSSLASEGVIGNSMKDSSTDHPPEKRAKLDSDQPSYVPPQNPQPPQELEGADEQPPPPLSPPPIPPPLPPMHHYPVPPALQSAGPMNLPLSYGITPLQPPALSGYPIVGPPMMNGGPPFAAPPYPYQIVQGSEGGYYSQSSSFAMAPMSRQ